MIEDRIQNIRIENGAADKYINEIRIIHTMQRGLDYIYRSIRNDEIKYKRYTNKIMKGENISYEKLHSIRLDQYLIINMYNWYSVSLVNMVEAIAIILIKEHKLTTEKREEYIMSVCGPEKAYRDKVGAHYAFLKNNKHDNQAEKNTSAFAVIALHNDRWEACPFVITTTSKGETSNNDKMISWNIIESYKKLQKRYSFII